MKRVIALCALIVCAGIAHADTWKITHQSKQNVWVIDTKPAPEAATEVADALAEVNAARQARGLRPYQNDPQLAQAALACARERARAGIHGHLASDFVHLPAGARADAAGCGALEDNWGWGSCCTYDDYSHAGAAWVRGVDGRRYMHLFVRSDTPRAAPGMEAPACSSGVSAPLPTSEPVRYRTRGKIFGLGRCRSGNCR